jgi:hypothetical protein
MELSSPAFFLAGLENPVYRVIDVIFGTKHYQVFSFVEIKTHLITFGTVFSVNTDVDYI